jgi:hypothetical protein
MIFPKKNILFFLVVGLVFLFALLVFSSGQGYLPYDNKSQFASYEPFETPFGSVELTSSPSPSPSQPPVSVNQPASSNFVPLSDSAKTIQYGDVNMPELIDKIGQTPKNGVDGVDGCVSSGFSNAGGSICLSPEMIQLLKSRGGNATGGSV